MKFNEPILIYKTSYLGKHPFIHERYGKPELKESAAPAPTRPQRMVEPETLQTFSIFY
jgi:hypothetical protein